MAIPNAADHRRKGTRERLEKCWELDINWNLHPDYLREVHILTLTVHILTLGIVHILTLLPRKV